MTEENLAENTDSTAPDENQEGQQEKEEFEISLGSNTPESRKNNPMVARIIGQRDKARDENTELKQRIEQLEQGLRAKFQQTEAPKWSNFNSDEDYQNAVKDYMAHQVAQSEPKVDPIKQYQAVLQQNEGIERHYKKAEDLASKFPQYSDAEKVASEILGGALSQSIAIRSDNSAELMLYLGTNPQEAQRFKHLYDSDPIAATVELGRLDAKVSVQTKTKPRAPEPDEPLPGGSVKNVGHWQRQLDKLRESEDIQGAIQLKRQAKSEGVFLE